MMDAGFVMVYDCRQATYAYEKEAIELASFFIFSLIDFPDLRF